MQKQDHGIFYILASDSKIIFFSINVCNFFAIDPIFAHNLLLLCVAHDTVHINPLDFLLQKLERFS